MPTFQSVSLHPSVKSRFLQHEEQHPGQSVTKHHASNKKDTQHQYQQHYQQHSQHHQPLSANVATPRALLTRNPQALVDLFSRGQIRDEQQQSGLLIQMEGIRHQIALKMYQQTRTGRQILQLQRSFQQVEYSEPLIPSVSINALRLWNKQKQKMCSEKPYTISTGSRSLDELIAFPNEHVNSSFGYQQPISNPDITGENEGDTCSRGLPKGHVLRLSGTTGKTQLSLQLAAQACLHAGSRVRYIYSTAGHAKLPLAKRFKQILSGNIDNGTSGKYGRSDRLKQMEFQPITTASQLIKTLAILEEEWLQQYHGKDGEDGRTTKDDKDPVEMLVLDSLPLMLVEREDGEAIRSFERWLKKIARRHSVWIITTGVGSNTAASLDAADIHLHLLPETPTTTNVRLIRHLSKRVTSKDSIRLLHTNSFGMTTQEHD